MKTAIIFATLVVALFGQFSGAKQITLQVVSKASIDIDDGLSVEELKDEIANSIGGFPEHWTLSSENVVLDDGLSLTNYGLGNESVINMVARRQELDENHRKYLIYVKDQESGSVFTIQVFKLKTIAQIKKDIAKRYGCAQNDVVLKFEGREMRDRRIVGSFRVTDNSTLDLWIEHGRPIPSSGTPEAMSSSEVLRLMAKKSTKPITVTVIKPGGKKITVNPYTTDFLEKFKSLIYQQEPIPEDEQILLFEGQVLSGDHTMKWYGIENGSEIELQVREIDQTDDQIVLDTVKS